MLNFRSLLVWALVLIAHATAVPSIQPEAQRFGNLSNIVRLASLGDSYATGIGNGKRFRSWGDYMCSRFNQSYGSLVYEDPRFGGKENRNWEFLACSGKTIKEVLKEQVRRLEDGTYDAITLTVGGNDVAFSTIANDCIFGFNPITKQPCAKSLEKSIGIASKLHTKLDPLLAEVKRKLVPDTGRLYIVGYAKLLNDETTQCNNVSFGWWWQNIQMDRERRSGLNMLSDSLNLAIEASANRAGKQVVFVDWDPYVASCQGRFCEPDVTEPEVNRAGLMFYGPEAKDSQGDMSPDLDLETMDTSPTKTVRNKRSNLSWWLKIRKLQVLHAKSNAHRMIADLIIHHMESEKAKAAGLGPLPLPPSNSICPLTRREPEHVAVAGRGFELDDFVDEDCGSDGFQDENEYEVEHLELNACNGSAAI